MARRSVLDLEVLNLEVLNLEVLNLVVLNLEVLNLEGCLGAVCGRGVRIGSGSWWWRRNR